LLYTYYIFFAAWDSPSPISKDLQWVWGMWALVTVVFTIVMFNVLIAVIEKSYKDLVAEDALVETTEKLEMILEICELRILLYKFFCCGCTRSKRSANWLQRVSATRKDIFNESNTNIY
jgi:Na+/melibiose symporter-like transporter